MATTVKLLKRWNDMNIGDEVKIECDETADNLIAKGKAQKVSMPKVVKKVANKLFGGKSDKDDG